MDSDMMLYTILHKVAFIPDDAFSEELKKEGKVYGSDEVKLNAKFKFLSLKSRTRRCCPTRKRS